MVEKRESTGFMIKQRAYLKLFILTRIGANRVYGQQLIDDLRAEFKEYGFRPYHSEIYRSLHELLEDGYISRRRRKRTDDSYQEIYVYYIQDKEKVNAYKKVIKEDLERCRRLLDYGVKKNF